MTERDLTCEQRIDSELAHALVDIRKLWDLQCEDPDASDPDLGTLRDYGLSFDYVAPHTFDDQDTGYFRWQLSWGGPSDEFRFYVSPCAYGWEPDQIEYWFMDWFDGAHRVLTGEAKELLTSVFNDFDNMEATQTQYDEAMEGYEPDPTDFTDEDLYDEDDEDQDDSDYTAEDWEMEVDRVY